MQYIQYIHMYSIHCIYIFMSLVFVFMSRWLIIMTLHRLAISISRPICPVYNNKSSPASQLQIHITTRYPSNFRARIARRRFSMASGTLSQTPSSTATTTTTAASSVVPSPSLVAHEEMAGSGSGYVPRYVDIGINLTDNMYQGVYHGRKVPTDLTYLRLFIRVVFL